jgi:cytosine/adenosine deaminase-related metal-dependent hydrolase
LLRGLAALLGLAVLHAAALGWALRVPEPLRGPERGLQLGRVTLIEPGTMRRSAVGLRVDGGRIGAIGPEAASQDGAFAGAFVLPGLTDMHVHFPATGFPGDREYTSLLLLRHGVTRVRLTGGADPRTVAQLNAAILEGDLPGPRYFSCGPILDGPDPVIPGSRVVANPDEARAAVAELSAAGADCIKAYDRLDLATTEALRDAAHAERLPIIGHTPQALSLEQAHLDDLQHLRGAHPPFENEVMRYPYFLAAWRRTDEAWLDHVIETSRRYGMAHTPTLVAVEGTVVAADWNAWRRSRTMQLWLPHLRDGLWSGEVGFSPPRFISADAVAMVRDATVQMRRTVRRLYEAGIPLHTGTDSNAPNLVPGASLHRELALFVEAGLEAEQALELSTRRSPAFLGINAAGRLQVGAPADLVLFGEDPTRDLAALETLVAVVQDGRLYEVAELDARLERYQRHYSGFAFSGILMPSLRTGLRALTAWLRG